MSNIIKPAIPNNLITPLSSFIGREKDIAGVKQWFMDYRLVTLTGPGGCGKTRLALRVASELTAAYEHGVWLVEFASLSDPSLIPQAVASVLGVREYPGAELSQILVDFLSSRRSLLVFDNCEHLIAGIANLAQNLLQFCPNLSILATSREELGIPGEAIWGVPPLSLPIYQPWTDPAAAAQTVASYLKSESVRLFLARVAAVSPGFALTIENGPWVAEICRHLDGMPLAIELAAARVRSLSVQQISERLNDRFNLLTAGSRTAPLRQQTLAATLDWSYALLTEAERRVLQRLSVFAGGAALEAAEAVCNCDCVRPDEIMNVLAHLVDKSLVEAYQSSAEIRYRLLETIRQYAREKLSEQRDEENCRDCHLDYFVHWAEKAEPILTGPDQIQGLERFETEHDNLRAALEWSSLNENRARAGLRLAAGCGIFWRYHCYVSEGRRRFSVALAPECVQDRSKVHAHALVESANLAYLQADYPAEQELLEGALPIWRELGQEGRSGLAFTLELFGEIKTAEGYNDSALPLFQEALNIYSQLNEKDGISLINMQLGWVAIRTGNYPLAETHLQKFLALAQELGDKTGLTYAHSGLGEVAVRQKQFSRARNLLEKALTFSRERGDKWGEATILGSLGWLALRQQNFERMRDYLQESVSIRLDLGDKGGVAWCLEKLADAAVQEGEPHKAVKIFSCAAVLRIPVHAAIDPVDRPVYDDLLSDLRARLGQSTYAACQEEGQGMRIKEMVAYALSKPFRRFNRAPASEKEKYQGLSKRERETAFLIAQGKSNREIAHLMTIGEKTAETYVTRILNKLGFTSRVQIATWAVEKGLISTLKQ